MPAFTHGPWEVDAPDTLQIRTAVPDDEPKYVAGVVANGEADPSTIAQMYCNGKIDHEAEANARLIAAAPDMYDALKECYDFIEDIICHDCEYCSRSLDADGLRLALDDLFSLIDYSEYLGHDADT